VEGGFDVGSLVRRDARRKLLVKGVFCKMRGSVKTSGDYGKTVDGGGGARGGG